MPPPGGASSASAGALITAATCGAKSLAGSRPRRTVVGASSAPSSEHVIVGRVRRVAHAEARSRDVHVADADARVHVARHERAHELLEVAVDAGAESATRSTRETRSSPPAHDAKRSIVGVGDRLAEAGPAADLERRHDERRCSWCWRSSLRGQSSRA